MRGQAYTRIFPGVRPVADTVADFEALFARTWRIARTLDDRAEGRLWHATGTAAFTARGKGLATYSESVVVTNAALTMRASRRYVYRILAPSLVEIDFEDGSPFCRLAFVDGSATAVHRCRDDVYEGRVTLQSALSWHTHWAIAGPHKTIDIITRYDVRG